MSNTKKQGLHSKLHWLDPNQFVEAQEIEICEQVLDTKTTL